MSTYLVNEIYINRNARQTDKLVCRTWLSATEILPYPAVFKII